ncbi:formylglycine-generating enzyme family protein [uncultured Thiodictyon sp.]|uniref:formylglycine-generating enzyme family protein n=1 Tax=uncultured Thiodictyon sp. TaxID=1846217 RepID=UPI0025FB8C3E|nr:formylglycine-generating enzyme family protein [uncultured Thiodictyon sp.]
MTVRDWVLGLMLPGLTLPMVSVAAEQDPEVRRLMEQYERQTAPAKPQRKPAASKPQRKSAAPKPQRPPLAPKVRPIPAVERHPVEHQSVVEPEMVLIPAGSFSMGCQPDEQQCGDEERPAHRVQVAAFELGKYEVTFDEWDACQAAGGCSHRPSDAGWGRGQRPVINVSWSDAQQYVRWLSSQTGKAYRLPSEAEWEYAARAGTTTAFSTGNCINTNLANCNGTGADDTGCGDNTGVYLGKTQTVGHYPANPWGLYDMHGNVVEWVQDCWHEGYTGAPQTGSEWRDACAASGRRVVRGGSWRDAPWLLHSALRNRDGASVRSPDAGFRVARTL